MTPDSSAIIAAFAPWHPLHDQARLALRGVEDLIAHAELETYSTLTRLPAPFRVGPTLAAEYLRRRHSGERLVLPARERSAFADRLAHAGLAGGRVYDALIAATADHHDRVLISCDRRAVAVYERLGARIDLLA